LGLGCAGQQRQGVEPQLAREYREQLAQEQQVRPSHACLGEACGPATLVTSWTLGDPKTTENGDWALAFGDCRGTVCGPMTDVSTWVLDEPPGGYSCLGTACGPRVPPSSWTIEDRQAARGDLTQSQRQ
jgi:hypothetical protein